jgi:hypothetical protein
VVLLKVLFRCHPSLPAIPGYEQRVEFEYERLGTFAYHAAWDVFRGQILGRVAPNTCIATFNQGNALTHPSTAALPTTLARQMRPPQNPDPLWLAKP